MLEVLLSNVCISQLQIIIVSFIPNAIFGFIYYQYLPIDTFLGRGNEHNEQNKGQVINCSFEVSILVLIESNQLFALKYCTFASRKYQMSRFLTIVK